jgi:hypothetical protein
MIVTRMQGMIILLVLKQFIMEWNIPGNQLKELAIVFFPDVHSF